MNEIQIPQRGLPGLRLVRKAIGLTQDEVSKVAAGFSEGLKGPHHQSINAIECGRKDCTQAMQRRIALALCCDLADLLSVPSEARLASIKAAYSKRQAELDQAKAEALAAKAVGQ